MRDSRGLRLRRETLTQLNADEMTSVAGGSHLCGVTDTCADTLTHGPSIDRTCPSVPITDCLADMRPIVSYYVCP